MTDARDNRIFGHDAGAYRARRPSYPDALFDWLAQIAPARELAWDCGTGTGQAAQKLAQSYPELHYETAGGEVNVAAFLGMVHRRRYKAEDFAFCRRLRAIGIKSYICPDVPLGHTGAHRFYGDLWSAATSQSRIAAPPAIAQAAE